MNKNEQENLSAKLKEWQHEEKILSAAGKHKEAAMYIRFITEAIVNAYEQQSLISHENSTAKEKIDTLVANGIISNEMANYLHKLRMVGNAGAHDTIIDDADTNWNQYEEILDKVINIVGLDFKFEREYLQKIITDVIVKCATSVYLENIGAATNTQVIVDWNSKSVLIYNTYATFLSFNNPAIGHFSWSDSDLMNAISFDIRWNNICLLSGLIVIDGKNLSIVHIGNEEFWGEVDNVQFSVNGIWAKHNRWLNSYIDFFDQSLGSLDMDREYYIKKIKENERAGAILLESDIYYSKEIGFSDYDQNAKLMVVGKFKEDGSIERSYTIDGENLYIEYCVKATQRLASVLLAYLAKYINPKTPFDSPITELITYYSSDDGWECLATSKLFDNVLFGYKINHDGEQYVLLYEGSKQLCALPVADPTPITVSNSYDIDININFKKLMVYICDYEKKYDSNIVYDATDTNINEAMTESKKLFADYISEEEGKKWALYIIGVVSIIVIIVMLTV